MVEPSSRRLEALINAYDALFTTGRTLSKLKDDALADRLLVTTSEEFCITGRSLAWKLFFLEVYGGPLPVLSSGVSATHMRDSLQASRAKYVESLVKYMRAPDGSFEAGMQIPGLSDSQQASNRSISNLDLNNPLSLHNDNPWTEWFASVELRKTIRQDVERTFPDMSYFRDPEVQSQLTIILFLYASANPSIGYRQGMHELLAPLYHAVEFDAVPSSEQINIPDSAQLLGDVCGPAWIAADAWTLFGALMRGASQWYEWREVPVGSKGLVPPLSNHVDIHLGTVSGTQDYMAPIVRACNNIQSNLLRSVDPVLSKHMQSTGIEPQIYGIRWLRLLFTREFTLRDSMLLWDGLFAIDPTLELAQWLCVAMLVRSRNQLLRADYSGQLTVLLRYPALHPDPDRGSDGIPHHTSLLLRQALALQMAPSPPTGISVVLENRNLLGIPVEISEAPSHPDPRRSGHMPRDKSASTSDLRHPGHVLPRSPPPQPFSFPEGIARGLLERGESLGINKSLMSAVSEFRRNIPDLAASLVRSPNSVSPSSYPLIDERPPEERPPWEPRTRFEMEREIAHLRLNNKKMADSVSWIVDTLLQDESDGLEPERIKSIQSKKRDALESLAYVRDVLRGAIETIDEDRLYNEDEFQRRQSATQSGSSVRAGADVRFKLPSPAAPAPLPVADSWSKTANSSNSQFQPNRSRSPPKSANRAPTRFPPASVPTRRSLPNNNNSTILAPWNYTKSSFSDSTSLPAAVLPRPPPPTSTTLPPPRPPIADWVTSDQTPLRKTGKEAQSDPLGVLK